MEAHAHERPWMMGHAIVASGSCACMAMQANGRASRCAFNLMGDHVDGHPFGLTPIQGVNKPPLYIREPAAQRLSNPQTPRGDCAGDDWPFGWMPIFVDAHHTSEAWKDRSS